LLNKVIHHTSKIKSKSVEIVIKDKTNEYKEKVEEG